MLVVPPSVQGSLVPTDWARRRLVCGFDGSESAARGTLFAASSEGARRDHAITIEREQRRGDPADQLERVAVAATAPAIVMGTRGRAPWRAALLGSVSRRVLEHARRPVILVPPGALAAD